MPLTDSQRDHLAQRLREERERVLRALGRYDETLTTSEQDADGDLTKMPFHEADLATDTINREIDAQGATRMTDELADIDDALERLYRHPERFGLDERTGEEIPLERLELVPWARTRISHGTGPSRRAGDENQASPP